MRGFRGEGRGGSEGQWKKKKKKNNECNVVILFTRGVPAIPRAYPTRCVGCFNIHPGKKKKNRPSFLSRDRARFGRQRDSRLNSLMMALQVEERKKKDRKIYSEGPGVMQHAKRGQRNFPTVIKIHNRAPPLLSLWYVSIMRRAARLKKRTHTFHRQAADSLRNNSVFVCVCVSGCFPACFSHGSSLLCAKSQQLKGVFRQLKMFSLIKKRF